MNLIPWRKKREHEIETTPENAIVRFRQDMENLFERFFSDPWGFGGLSGFSTALASLPRTDLADSEKEVTVTMELPGVDPKDVDISVTGDLLTVRGEKKAETEEKKKDYHYVERQFGTFQRTVRLPSTIDPEKVDATFKNGVLTIRIAKHPDAVPRKITVRNA